MVQIIRGPESQSSIRQRALNDSLSGAINAWGEMEKSSKQDAATERQQALDLMKTTQDLRKEGYDVTEDQVKQYLAPEKTQSFGDKLKTMFTGEEAPKQERPDLYGKRTPEYIAKQEQAKATAELEKQAKTTDIKTKEYSLREMEETSPYKRRKMELENQKAQQDNSMYDLQKQKLQAEIGKTYADSQKAQREARELNVNPAAAKLAKMGGETQGKVGAIASGLRALDGLTASINNGIGPQQIDANTPLIGRFKTDNSFTQNQRILTEVVGRLQSGGAIQEKELESFNAMGPRPGDTKEQQIKKLEDQTVFLKNKLTAFGLRDGDLKELGFDVGQPSAPQQNANEIVKQVQTMSRADKIKLLQAGG